MAWTVVAHTAFERGAFDRRRERLRRGAGADAGEGPPAATNWSSAWPPSIYKQGEQARAAGKPREAVAHFDARGHGRAAVERARDAQYDAAAALIALKDWDGATRALEDFRQRFPNHPLQAEVGSKLAVAYLEKRPVGAAAGEFERLAATQQGRRSSRAARCGRRPSCTRRPGPRPRRPRSTSAT